MSKMHTFNVTLTIYGTITREVDDDADLDEIAEEIQEEMPSIHDLDSVLGSEEEVEA